MLSLRSPSLNDSFSNRNEMLLLEKVITIGDNRLMSEYFSLWRATEEKASLSKDEQARYERYNQAAASYQPKNYEFHIPQQYLDRIGTSNTGMRIFGKFKPEYVMAGLYVITMECNKLPIHPVSSESEGDHVKIIGHLVKDPTDKRLALFFDSDYRTQSLKYSYSGDLALGLRVAFADQALSELPKAIKETFYPEYETYHTKRDTLIAEQKHFSQSAFSPFFHSGDIVPYLFQIVQKIHPTKTFECHFNKKSQKSWIDGLNEADLKAVSARLIEAGINKDDILISAKTDSTEFVLQLEKPYFQTLKLLAVTFAKANQAFHFGLNFSKPS